MMSEHNVQHFFRFPRVRIMKFGVSERADVVIVKLAPSLRWLPICSGCLKKVRNIHSYHVRPVRDLPMSGAIVVINLHYRKVRCPECGIRVEHHEFVAPYARYTHRLAQFVFSLCEHMAIQQVSELLQLSWNQVKTIDHSELRQRYQNLRFDGLRILTVDEISFRKHHKYLTVIANFETGQVIGVVEDRKYDSLANFLKKMPLVVRKNIEAVAIDMWNPYIKAIGDHLPDAEIVFDLFHVRAAFSRIIDKIRNEQFRGADTKLKKFMKRSRFLLLKNPQNLRPDERPRLQQILNNNETLATVYILKDYLNRLWQYKYRACAKSFLVYWCQLALDIGNELLTKFVTMLMKYNYGIFNHCQYPIHTSKIEGINNKIKVIKKRAYGYHDLQYFALKIIHATSN